MLISELPQPYKYTLEKHKALIQVDAYLLSLIKKLQHERERILQQRQKD